MPMTLVGLDEDDIAGRDRAFAGVVGDDPLAMGDDQDLLRSVPVPPVSCTLDEGYRRDSLRWGVPFGDEVLGHHRADEHLLVDAWHTPGSVLGYDLDHDAIPFCFRLAATYHGFTVRASRAAIRS